MSFRRSIVAAVLAPALVLGACAKSDFASGGGGARADRKPGADAAGVDQNAGTTLGNSAPGGGAAPQPLPAQDSAGNVVIPATVDQCLRSKADDYNLVLVFDNSGSQKRTDPLDIRRVGAHIFVDQFEEFVQRSPGARVRMAVISFNSQSVRGARGWVTLNGSNHFEIKDEITQATSNPGGGTAYSPALRDAAAYFELLRNYGVPQERSRNYVVFLTDGAPNAASGLGGGFFPGGGVERMEDIPAAIAVLVNQHGVAVMAVASGLDISGNGEVITQSLAEPRAGLRQPDHIGRYFRARTAEDLRGVWQQILDSIGNCQ